MRLARYSKFIAALIGGGFVEALLIAFHVGPEWQAVVATLVTALAVALAPKNKET